MFRSRRALASAVAGLVAASGAIVALDALPASAKAPGTVTVFITKDHVVRMTSRMHPGAHKFVIRSERSASFQILRTRHGYTDKELDHDVTVGLDGGNMRAFKRFERNVKLLGGVASTPGHRGVMYVNLARGQRYIAVDTNASSLGSVLHHFSVGGRRVGGGIPEARTLRAIQEMTWARSPRRIAPSGLLGFANRATENHFVVMAKLKAGKTMRDWRRFVNKAKSGQNPGVPPVRFNIGLFSGVVSPGHRIVMKYDLPRGRYVLTCFWGDADEGGLPHAFMGMYRKLIVR